MLAVNCGNPGKPLHGKITESGFTYKKVVSYSCDKYFELHGPKTRQCLADGKWSGEQPKCVASKWRQKINSFRQDQLLMRTPF